MGEVRGESPQPPGSWLCCPMSTILRAEKRDAGKEGTCPSYPAPTQPSHPGSGFLPSLARKFSPN